MLHLDRISSLALGPKGRLVSGSFDRTARLWRIGGWTPGKEVNVDRGALYDLFVLSDGKLALVTPLSNTPRIGWPVRGTVVLDTATGQNNIIHQYTRPPSSNPLATFSTFSLGGADLGLASTESGLQLWNLLTKERLALAVADPDIKGPVALSPDGSFMAGILTKHEGLFKGRFWKLATGEPMGETMTFGKELVVRLVFSGDGSKLLAANQNNTAQLWEVPSGRLLHTWRHKGPVEGVAFSRDGKLAATGAKDDTARIWDVATGQPVGVPLAHSGNVMAVAFSPDGKVLITGSQNRQACLWGVASGRQLGTALPHPASVRGVAFLPGGKQFATSCYDGKVRIFDLPEPIQSDPADVQRWIERITGQQLHADGFMSVLDAEDWLGRGGKK